MNVIFHASCKIAAFTDDAGKEICALIPGDNFLMDERSARHLQQEGAGVVRYEPIKDVATFIKASDLKDGAR